MPHQHFNSWSHSNLCFYMLQARALKVSPAPQSGPAAPVPNPPAKQKLAPMDAKNAQQTDEILNSILPPRYEYLSTQMGMVLFTAEVFILSAINCIIAHRPYKHCLSHGMYLYQVNMTLHFFNDIVEDV